MAALQTPWYDRTVEALQLNGKGERTRQVYARAVRLLIEFHGKEPDQISEDELKAYFLHRKNVTGGAISTPGIHRARISWCRRRLCQKSLKPNSEMR